MVQSFTVIGAVLPGYLCLQGGGSLGDAHSVESVAVIEICVRVVWPKGRSIALMGIPGFCFPLCS